ncbi:MAG: helix-turn-helix transcriptional regulator [Afipia sp.]|nr:helix-turn-helix transcriptional regulator [Afipia sp.]
MLDFSGKGEQNQRADQQRAPGKIVSLGKLLKTIRSVRGHSLRTVEEATGISNAYLSQLERGEAQNPAPDKLHSLADFYVIPYNDLMRAAGYLQTAETPQGAGVNARTSAIQAALMSATLSPEEEDAVVKYIEFLRFQHKKG